MLPINSKIGAILQSHRHQRFGIFKKNVYICSKEDIYKQIKLVMEENNLLEEQTLITESQNWGAKEWIDYLSKEGTMTLDDFRSLNKKIIDETFCE